MGPVTFLKRKDENGFAVNQPYSPIGSDDLNKPHSKSLSLSLGEKATALGKSLRRASIFDSSDSLENSSGSGNGSNRRGSTFSEKASSLGGSLRQKLPGGRFGLPWFDG